MADESELMKELAAAAEPCFDTADRLAVYCEMNLGAVPHAFDDLISAVVGENHPMPAGADRRTQGMARRRSKRRQRRLPPPTGGAPRPRPNPVTWRVGGYLFNVPTRQIELC